MESTESEIIGYWYQTWEEVKPPEGANLAIAFSGYSSVAEALSESATVLPSMVGEKYLAVGGGVGPAGQWTTAAIEAVTSAVEACELSAYVGIAFDVEICQQQGLSSAFLEAFAKAKAQGLGVLVTVSHSEPFGCQDAIALMKAFLGDSNIDYISPQLYTTGDETMNDYTAIGTPWSAYADSKAVVIPSIVRASLYTDAVEYFAGQGVTLGGFVRWNNSGETND